MSDFKCDFLFMPIHFVRYHFFILSNYILIKNKIFNSEEKCSYSEMQKKLSTECTSENVS